MKPRLVLAALMPRDVIARAREEFDTVVAPGPADMTVAEVIDAATAHRADAIQSVNTLPLTHLEAVTWEMDFAKDAEDQQPEILVANVPA